MATSEKIHDQHVAIDLNTLAPSMISTSKGEMEAVTWGEGPAVLALHGAMGGYDQGILLARTVLRPRFKCVAVSRPGYLRTRLSLGRTPQDQADLCAEVLTMLGIKSAIAVAISGGGPAALQFALRHKGRCTGLVMISACSHRLAVAVPLRWYLMKLTARFPGIVEKMRRRIEQYPAKAMERAVPETTLRDRLMGDKESAELLFRLQTSVFKDMRLRIEGSDNDIRVTRGDMDWPLEAIDVPLLVIHGTSDSMVPYQQAELLTRRVPGAELFSIEGGEHVCIFTHRAEVNERIEAFLSSLDAHTCEEQ
jgi:pimeloyl-ACP methyl ester carboxylesterase